LNRHPPPMRVSSPAGSPNSIAYLLPREWATLSPPEQTGLLELFSKYGVITELTDMVSHEPPKLSKQCVLTEDGWLRLWNGLCANSAVALLSRDKARFIFRGELARNRQAPERLHARRSAADVQARWNWSGWHSYALRSVGPHVTFIGFVHCFVACAARVPGGLATLRLAGATTLAAQSTPRAATPARTSTTSPRPRGVIVQGEEQQQPEQRRPRDDVWPPSPVQLCERFPGTLREETHLSCSTAFGFTSAANAAAHRLSLQPKRELVLMSAAISKERAHDGRAALPIIPPTKACKPPEATPTSITADWRALQASMGSGGTCDGGSVSGGSMSGGLETSKTAQTVGSGSSKSGAKSSPVSTSKSSPSHVKSRVHMSGSEQLGGSDSAWRLATPAEMAARAAQGRQQQWDREHGPDAAEP